VAKSDAGITQAFFEGVTWVSVKGRWAFPPDYRVPLYITTPQAYYWWHRGLPRWLVRGAFADVRGANDLPHRAVV